MACSTKAGTSCFITYFNEQNDVRITGRDWHGIRTLAEVESGQRLTRTRAKAKDTNAIFEFLRKADGDTDSDAVNLLRSELEKSTPTEGTLRAVSYLQRHGVQETLAKVRGEKPVDITTQYSAIIRDGHQTFVQTYDSAVSMGSALHDLPPSCTYTVSATSNGETTELDAIEARRIVDEGWREHTERNKVIPDEIIYSASVQSASGDDNATYVHHSTNPSDVRDFVKGFPYGSKVSVFEERRGSTIANPNWRSQDNVEMSEPELATFLQEPDQD